MNKWADAVEEMRIRALSRAPERVAFLRDLALQAFTLYDLSGRVLDVGSGSGWAGMHLPNLTSYVGIDPVYSSEYPKIIKGVGEDLPFADESFDSILCHAVLQSSQDPGMLLDECHRVLCADGRIGLMVCVDCDDPLFTFHWTADEARTLISAFFRIQKEELLPGYRAIDGSNLVIRGIR